MIKRDANSENSQPTSGSVTVVFAGGGRLSIFLVAPRKRVTWMPGGARPCGAADLAAEQAKEGGPPRAEGPHAALGDARPSGHRAAPPPGARLPGRDGACCVPRRGVLRAPSA